MRIPTGQRFGPAVAACLDAVDQHVFDTVSRCQCGFQPDNSLDWDRHVIAVVIDAAGAWLESRTSDTLGGDPFLRAADWAAQTMRAGAFQPEVAS